MGYSANKFSENPSVLQREQCSLLSATGKLPFPRPPSLILGHLGAELRGNLRM